MYRQREEGVVVVGQLCGFLDFGRVEVVDVAGRFALKGCDSRA